MLTFEKFNDYAKKYNIIPLYSELIVDIETPVSIFSIFKDEKYTFLLESVETDKKFARYSIIGIDPFKILIYKNKILNIITNNSSEQLTNINPLDYLDDDLKKFKIMPIDELPFLYNAIIGYFGFETFELIENLKFDKPDKLDIPDICLNYCKKILIFDHFKNKLFLINNIVIDEDKKQDLKNLYERGLKELETLSKKIAVQKNLNYLSTKKNPQKNQLEYSSDESVFLNGVNKIKDYITAGDIFQCVLSIRSEMAINTTPFDIYRALRIINPSPYMFYMNFDDFTLVGSSPETMVRLRDNMVYLKPIAGTRPVVKSETETQMYADELISNEKEIAEHLMLLDLGRNDLGRICKPGTVKVDKQMYVERFAHVQHIVSDISGEVADNKSVVDVFKATFLAGTVSGAPKIRAIEIINELEPFKRNFYAGAVGYITFNNQMDLAITIRTMLVKNKRIYIQTGAGVVYDSIDKLEYKECANKARSLVAALYLAENGEEPIL